MPSSDESGELMAFQHILVATDFSPCSEVAIDQAIDMALQYRASLTVVHAFEMRYGYAASVVGQLMIVMQDAAEEQLAKLLERVRARIPGAAGVVRCGSAWEQILDVADKEKIDLIVVGSHGRKGLPRAVLGSVAEKVVRLSPVSVLTVHGSAAASS